MNLLSYIVIGMNVIVDVLLFTTPDVLFSAFGVALWGGSFFLTILCMALMWKTNKRIVGGLLLTLSPILYNLIVPFVAGVLGYQTIY